MTAAMTVLILGAVLLTTKLDAGEFFFLFLYLFFSKLNIIIAYRCPI